MVMENNAAYLSQISEGFGASLGGGSLFLAALGVLAVIYVVWGIHYHHKRRHLSPYEQL